MNVSELNEYAMEMIVHAGNGRRLLNEALDALYEFDENTYEEKMKQSREEMKLSHAAQTNVLQETITDESLSPNILFTHAQDTLMTVMSEINTAKHLEKIMKKIMEMSNEK